MRNVVKYLLAIVTTNLILAIGEGTSLGTHHTHYHCSFDVVRMIHFSTISFQIALVSVNAVIIVVAYRAISTQFAGRFWDPILLPFKALFFCRCTKKDKYQTMTISERTLTWKLPEDSNRKKLPASESDVKNCTDSVELPAIGRSFEEQNVEPELPCEHSFQSRTLESPTSATNWGTLNSECDVIGSNNTIRTNQESKKRKQMHKLTSTFFFVGLAFILISIPRYICMIAMMISQDLRSTPFFWQLIIASYLFYGLGFVLNPYMYAFNSGYLKQEIRLLVRNITILRKAASRELKNLNITNYY